MWKQHFSPYWETTVVQQCPCSQSRVNRVRITERGEKKGGGGMGRGLEERPWSRVGRNRLEVWGWGHRKEMGDE